MVTMTRRTAILPILAASLLLIHSPARTQSVVPWVDRAFQQARMTHVQKEYVGFAADLSVKEAFLQQLIESNTTEIKLRKRNGGQIPGFQWPGKERADSWQLTDTLNLLKTFEDYRDALIKDYEERLNASRALKRDLIATANSLEISRMRQTDWVAFQGRLSSAAEATYDPTLAMILSDEYRRNYPQALADSFWFNRGEAALAGGYYLESIASYTNVMKQEGSQFRNLTFERLAFLYAEMSDLESANQNWERWSNAGKPHASTGRVQFHTGRVRFEAGDYPGATVVLSEIPRESDYYYRGSILNGVALGLNGKYDQALTALNPIVNEKLVDKLQITKEIKTFALLKYAQLLCLSGKTDEAYKRLKPLSWRDDPYGDQVLITRAWINRSQSHFTEMNSILDTLIKKQNRSPFVPLAQAWQAEILELKSGSEGAKPELERILSMLDQNQKLTEFTEERYELYNLLTQLSMVEEDIVRSNDIGLFAKYLDERRRVELLLSRNRNGAALAANPAVEAIYKEEVASMNLFRDLKSIEKKIDFEKGGKNVEKFMALKASHDAVSERIADLMTRARVLTPALQNEQEIMVLSRKVKQSGRSTMEALANLEAVDSSNSDRALFEKRQLDRLSTVALASRLDQIETGIDKFATFAMQRYALGGLDYDVLSRKRDRSEELTFYIKRLEQLLEERQEESEEAAAQEALTVQPTSTPAAVTTPVNDQKATPQPGAEPGTNIPVEK